MTPIQEDIKKVKIFSFIIKYYLKLVSNLTFFSNDEQTQHNHSKKTTF